MTDDAQELTVTLPVSLPYGKYTITLCGNMDSGSPLSDDATEADLEHADAAQKDVYTASLEMDYSLGSENFRVEMERTKGCLIIKAEGLPDEINMSEKTVSDVYSTVSSSLEYSSPVSLTYRTDWAQPNEIITSTLTGPSNDFDKSALQMSFHDSSGAADSLYPDDIQITMGRNELTVVRYVYAPESGGDGFNIYVLVDDS